jgi:inorganic phosphate transporter, PiT family
MNIVIVVFCGLFLAYANGANDNFKGVATLFGSGTTSYRSALILTTVCTFLGSVTALFIAEKLLITFTGKGIIPSEIALTQEFALAVALAGGGTVILATILGFPISTTHALTGGLVGVGLLGSSPINVIVLFDKIMIPLLISPLLAVFAAIGLYLLFSHIRIRSGISEQYCLCIGRKVQSIAPVGLTKAQAISSFSRDTVFEANFAPQASCITQYSGRFLGVNAPKLIDLCHYLSACAVCFARGLNDTPKIAAILLVSQVFEMRNAILLTAIAIAIGGIMSARKVAHKMSKDVTEMNAGQGFTANFVTSMLVIAAAFFSLPVSTTHVSCSALFGIGAVTGKGKWSIIRMILLSWIVTLPVAALLGCLAFELLR